VRLIDLPAIRQVLCYREVIDCMRPALIAYSRGECDMPMPMHLNIAASSEVHIKSSYRRGGAHYALKVASTFDGKGNGMMLLISAETGDPLVFLADAGHLTDVRTAAVAALMARELGRTDTTLGILGTGIQARLEARMHAEVLDLRTVWIWGRSRERATACAHDVSESLPGVDVRVAASPAEVASACRLIVTCTASLQPLLALADLQPGTHISAVGSDSPGKQELDPAILRSADLLLVDSRMQCEKLGELQHAPSESSRAVEMGTFLEAPSRTPGISVGDFTGLGVEDLYIAEYCYTRSVV